MVDLYYLVCNIFFQACLSCSNVACGRYIKEHAVKHYQETKHPLALEVNEKYAYWYVECISSERKFLYT